MQIKHLQIPALKADRKSRAKVQVLHELSLHRVHLVCQGLIRVPPMLPRAVKETAQYKRIVAMEEQIKRSMYEHEARAKGWKTIEDAAAHGAVG